MEIERMVQHSTKFLDGARQTFLGVARERMEQLLRKLKEPMVPQHDSRHLENISEDVLSGRRHAVQNVSRIRQGYCHIRSERTQGCNRLVDTEFIAERKGMHVHFEDISPQCAHFIRHLDGKVIVDAAEPMRWWKRNGNSQSF